MSAPTPDGRYVVIDGRRWRATDPSIPDDLRRRLVDELMAARRAVGAAKRAADLPAEQAARRRVHDAKVGLGERRRPWWDPAGSHHDDDRLAAVRRALGRTADAAADGDDESDLAADVRRFEAAMGAIVGARATASTPAG